MKCSNCGNDIPASDAPLMGSGGRTAVCTSCTSKGKPFRETVSLDDAPQVPATPLKERELRD